MKGKGQNDAGASSSERTPPGKGTALREKSDPALGDSNLGTALRSAYQQTIEEDIPSEMLDLLKKLS